MGDLGTSSGIMIQECLWEYPLQEEHETLKLKDTQFASVQNVSASACFGIYGK